MNVRTICLMLTVSLAGCGGSKTSPGGAVEGGPLTAEGWKALTVDEKYTPTALERLKAGDPRLDTPEGWETFSKTTLMPEKKKDRPKLKK